MRQNTVWTATLSLAVVLAVVCLGILAAQAAVPNVVVPRLTVPVLAAISLVALAGETVVFGTGKREWTVSFGLAALCFGILPLCAGWVESVSMACKAAALGAVVYLVCEMLYCSILDRLSSGAVRSRGCLAVGTAVMLLLAVQALAGIGL